MKQSRVCKGNVMQCQHPAAQCHEEDSLLKEGCDMSAGRACHKRSCKSLGMSSRSSTDVDMSRLGKLLRDTNGIPVFYIGIGVTLMSAASPLLKQGAGPGEDVLPVTRHAGKVSSNAFQTKSNKSNRKVHIKPECVPVRRQSIRSARSVDTCNLHRS